MIPNSYICFSEFAELDGVCAEIWRNLPLLDIDLTADRWNLSYLAFYENRRHFNGYTYIFVIANPRTDFRRSARRPIYQKTWNNLRWGSNHINLEVGIVIGGCRNQSIAGFWWLANMNIQPLELDHYFFLNQSWDTLIFDLTVLFHSSVIPGVDWPRRRSKADPNPSLSIPKT